MVASKLSCWYCSGVLRTNKPSSLIDSRTGWSCEVGEFMVIGLGIKEEVAGWQKMELPDSAPLRKKLAELESLGFVGNFEFADDSAKAIVSNETRR